MARHRKQREQRKEPQRHLKEQHKHHKKQQEHRKEPWENRKKLWERPKKLQVHHKERRKRTKAGYEGYVSADGRHAVIMRQTPGQVEFNLEGYKWERRINMSMITRVM